MKTNEKWEDIAFIFGVINNLIFNDEYLSKKDLYELFEPSKITLNLDLMNY